MTRSIHVLFVFLALLMVSLSPSYTQEGGATSAQESLNDDPRAATGGAQTLEDIMARQRGEIIPPRVMPGTEGNASSVEGSSGQLAPLGYQSDADVFRAFRDGSADMISSDSSRTGTVVMQDGGMLWLSLREGPLRLYGGLLLLGMISLLVVFYIFRGKIMIEGEITGDTIIRFKLVERIMHWVMAISFLTLGATGLLSLFGRIALIPIFGHESFSGIAAISKWVHNYISWVFMLALIMMLIMWGIENLPKRHDIKWLQKAGGLFTTGVHPPAGKFNAGEKILFWMIMFFGIMVSVTGLSLLFPYQIVIFEPVFQLLNMTGIPQFLGLGEIGINLAPQEEMQIAQLLHASIAFFFMAIIFAHMYLGSIGMEGALESMTSGEVSTQWAKEHHDIWYEDHLEKQDASKDEKEPAE